MVFFLGGVAPAIAPQAPKVERKRKIDVASIRARLIVGQHASRRFEFMINFRDGDDVAMTRYQRSRAADRRGHLKNLGVKQNARITSVRFWPKDVRSHRTRWRVEINEFALFESHDRADSIALCAQCQAGSIRDHRSEIRDQRTEDRGQRKQMLNIQLGGRSNEPKTQSLTLKA